MADGVNGQDLQNVIVTVHPFFDLYGVNSFQIPQGVAFLNAGDNISRLRNNGISFFAQDDWRIVPSLTLSGGLRYDYDTQVRCQAESRAPARIGVEPGQEDRHTCELGSILRSLSPRNGTDGPAAVADSTARP